MNTALFSGSDLDVVFSLVLTMSLSASWIAAAVLVLRPEAGAEVGKRAALGHRRGAAGAAGLD